MPSNESSTDLESRISAVVESTVGRMRSELLQRLQATEERLREITGQLQGGEDAPATAPAVEPVTEPATGGDPAADLFEAVAAIDRGTTQQEVLAAMLEGAGRFAGRSALFLTHAETARGWGSYGFRQDGDIQAVALSYGEGPLAILAEGRGGVALDADDCAALCRQMNVEPGAEGLLVPFVLRDRLAAAFYVDRSTEDPPLDRRAVQLLTYVGALAVEGLGLRQRPETPTLRIATDDAAAPGVALWESAETAPADAEPLPATAEPAPTEPTPEPAISEPSLSEPQLTEPVAPVAPPPAEATLEEVIEEQPADASATQPIGVEPPTETEPAVESIPDEEWQLPDLSTETPAEEPAAALAPESSQLVEPAAEPAPWEAADSGAPTVDAEPASEVAQPASAPEPAAAISAESTEVRPPTDVSGPGWAFTASRAAAEDGDDAQHEEARRLARLLVTEIKLYNEEQVEEGRNGNDIYARLREDIDRSRQIFNERVDEAVRQESDYFHEEMVRILGGGNAETLGL